MMFRLAVAALLLSVAVALPFGAEDLIVPESPETTLVEVEVGSRAMFEAAKAKVMAMVQNQAKPNGETDYTECETLANDAASQIESSVATEQSTLDGLYNGDTCKDKGQEEVTKAEEAKKQADEAEVTATTNMDAAYEEGVQLQPQKFSSLKESTSCDWIQSDANYEAADSHYNEMVGTHEDAVAHAQAKGQELTLAIAEAARLKHECECEVKTEHANTWETANASNDENQKAWTQAHHMLCVVFHKSYENCDVPACKAVTKPYINEEAANANCEGESEQPTAVEGESEQPPVVEGESEQPAAEQPAEAGPTIDAQGCSPESDVLCRTDDDIRPAVLAWIDNPREAEGTYGHISKWHTQRVTNMEQLFDHKFNFNDNISAWDVSAVTKMAYMFFYATSFNQDLSRWNVAASPDVRQMFDGSKVEQNEPNWYYDLAQQI